MNKSFLVFLIVFITTISCKKNNTENNYNGTYTTSNIITIAPPKMYTSFGIVNDIQLIKSYLNRARNLLIDTNFIFDRSTETKNLNITITFVENDSILVKFTNPNSSFKLHIFKNTLNQFVLTPHDSSTIYTNISQTIERLYDIDYSLEKNNIGAPIFKTYYNNGPHYIGKALYRSTILIENGELSLPILTQHITLPYSESYSVNNLKLFNENFSNLLQLSDTVVIQTKTVKLIRQ